MKEENDATKQHRANVDRLFVGLWETVFDKVSEMLKFCQESSKKTIIPVTYPFQPVTTPDKTIKCSIPSSNIEEMNDLLALVTYLAELVAPPEEETEVDTTSMVT